MKHNLLVWCVHSCRRDVFLGELGRGKLPNFQSLVDNGLFFSSAIVGGHYQKVSNHTEITGRPVTSSIPPTQNLLNAAKQSGAHVSVVNDGPISGWAKALAAKKEIGSVEEIYPEFLPYLRLADIETPRLEFRPDLGPSRWLYWYRCRATHRPFASLPLAFGRDGGFLEEIVNENPGFVRDQQRYALWLQDRWLGVSLDHLRENDVLSDTVIAVFSSHGTSLEGWQELTGKVTKATVDHTAFNFHPNVSRSFACLSGPGIPNARCDDWVSIMDLKPTLTAHLDIEDPGGSVYGVDWLAGSTREPRILADISSREMFSLYDTASDWLYMSLPMERADWMDGLPESESGWLAFHLGSDPLCGTPRNRDLLESTLRIAFREEIERLGLVNRLS